MRLTVVGAGYVGLVVGACLADAGNHVHIVDTDAERVAELQAGRVPIYEPGLGPLVAGSIAAERLLFGTLIGPALKGAEVVFLAVGTPAGPEGTPDLSALLAASRSIAAEATGPLVVAVKSTVPVGLHRHLTALFQRECPHPVELVSNPEFLKEGSAVADFMSPDRVIVGSTSAPAIAVLRHLYAPFMRRSDRLIAMSPASAELTKYASNAMLALRVSFINDMSRLAEHAGADITEIRAGVGSDSRIGAHFLHASLGYGGSCFPKDVSALAAMGRAAGEPQHLVEAAAKANEAQQDHFFERIRDHFGGKLSGRALAVWGLTYKARTDDLRQSPAVRLVRRLLSAGARVSAHDPVALDRAARELSHASLVLQRSAYDALDRADALVICTEWQEYRAPDLQALKARMATPTVFDGRNLYDPGWMAEAGVRYLSVGRPTIEPQRG